jgi:hypothetical protein
MQAANPIENSKQTKSKAKPSTQANPAPDQASKTQQARQSTQQTTGKQTQHPGKAKQKTASKANP